MGISLSKSTISPTPNAIEVYKGASKDVALAITRTVDDVNGKAEDIPFDLTGCTLTFSLRTNAASPELILSKVSTDPTQIAIDADLLKGLATIFIDFTDTKDMEPGSYQFDVWVDEPSGKRYPVVEPAEFKIKPAITRFGG